MSVTPLYILMRYIQIIQVIIKGLIYLGLPVTNAKITTNSTWFHCDS